MVDHPRRAAVFARTATPQLCASLRTIETMPATAETRQARVWLIDELERRHPAASEVVQREFEQAERDERSSGAAVEVDYVDVLVTAIEEGSRSERRARTTKAT